jgi:uncharacterized protein (TIGR02285 family)
VKPAVLFLLMMLVVPAYATDEMPLIEWFVSRSPPLTIVKGPFHNQGYGDAVYRQIRNKLEDYGHERRIVPLGHGQNAIMHHDNVCAYDLLKTAKRAKYMIFSKPLYSVLPLGALSLADHDISAMLDNQGYFMLSKLAQSDNFLLGLAANRSYGAMLDKRLKKLEEGGAKVTRLGNNLATGLINMMRLKRVDASLGYAVEAFYLTLNDNRLSEGKPRVQVLYHPIKGQPALLTGHVGCNRSEFGQRIITAINQRLDNNDSDIISQAYQRWLPASTLPLYQKLISKH